MKRVAVILLIAVLCFSLVGSIAFAASPDKEWSQTFGGLYNDYAESMQQTSDGGYIITGNTQFYVVGPSDVWLIKTSPNGIEQWNKTFGGSSSDHGYSVQQTSDFGYILAGDTTSYGAGNYDVWLIKTDSDGNPEWVDSDTGQIGRTFGGSDWDLSYSVQQTSDSGYVMVGGTRSYGSGNSDVWLIKTDSNGNKVWDKTFGGSDDDCGYSVQQTSDGGYIIAGYTQGYWPYLSDVWLIKTDSDGNQEWNKTFGSSNYDYGRSVKQTFDGGYIITGYTASYGAGNNDVWLIKTDSDGNKVWDKTFGGAEFDQGYSVQQTSDGGYIVTGYTESYGAGNWDMWLIKTGPSGNKTWDKTFGGAKNEYGSSVHQASDGGYIIAGSTDSYGSGLFDVWLVKVEPEAPAIPSIDSISPISGNQGETLDIIITGANLTGATYVSLGIITGIAVNSFTVDSDTQITTSITIDPGATPGTRDVSVTTPDGSGTLTGGFTVTAPSIPTVTGTSPGSGNQGKTLNVTITGANLTGATDVSFGNGITVNSFTVDSDTQITTSITIDPGATPGTRDVSVTTTNVLGTLTGGFTVTVPSLPTITEVNPSSGAQGETLDVTITGTNLTGATDVSLGTGITVNSFTVGSDTQITASITIDSDASLSTRDVMVTTLDGSDTLASGFMVATPSSPKVTGMSPGSGAQGKTLDVTITGANLTGATNVSLGTGINVNSFKVGSDTEITASITIDSDATPGPRAVSVTTPNGFYTLASVFTVMGPTSPTVTGISPNSGNQWEALNVTITGANFTGSTHVSLGTGISVNSFTVDSDTQITASIAIDSDATPGTRDVSVTTSYGSGTLTSGFTVTGPLTPTVTGINPSSGDQGEILDVTITGANLTGATVINFGTGITVNSFTVDSDTQITVNISIDAKALTKERNVSVTTPGGTDTLENSFTVNQDQGDSSFKLFFKPTNFWIFFIAVSEAVIIVTCLAYFMAYKKSR